MIGNRLEILEAIEILQGKGREDVTEFICELAQIMLGLANVEKSIEEVRQHIDNGAALKKFEEMVLAQGGDLEDLYRPVQVTQQVPVLAEEDGYLVGLPALEFGLFAMKLGAGRAVKTDDLDYETGIVFHKKVGKLFLRVNKSQRFMPMKIFRKTCLQISKNVKIDKESVKRKKS